MGIKVVLHRVLVKRDIPEDTEAVKTKKDLDRLQLATPDWVREKIENQALRENASMDKGTVVAIGDTAFRDYGIQSPIQVGDYIAFAKFGGKEVNDPETGETLVIINDEDVVAVLTK